MCYALKYGIWNVSEPGMETVNALVSGGYAPLSAMVLAARGLQDPRQADKYLDCNAQLIDPYLMTDMGSAVSRVRQALQRGEKMAVFGDYDADGVSAAANADGVKWWVVECERLCNSLNAIKPSFDFLKSNGYV